MIKKTLLGLGITILSFISFTNADDISHDLPYNFYIDNNFESIYENLNFESDGGNWLYKQYSNGAVRSIFWNNGKLYTYYYESANSNYQGYFDKVCKIYSETGYLPSSGPICLNSYEFTTSGYNEFYNLQNPNFTKAVSPVFNNFNYYSPVLCFYDSITQYFYCFNLENHNGGSLNIVGRITDFSEYAENSPFGNGTGNTPIQTGTNSNYICPTIGQLMKNMGENYNTGLCYNNTTYYNGNTFEQIEKQDIFTIFNNNYQEYTNRISIYRNNCTNANTTQACQGAFSGEYKKYSIINNAMNSNVDEKKLRNYCNLGLNYDPNATTCVASGGGIKEPYTTEEMIKDIINNGVIATPKTTGENQNNVINALNKCENGDRECYINDRNFIESMKNIYGKITGLFKERNGVNGIIPNYILRITFMTILFTVIFKK